MAASPRTKLLIVAALIILANLLDLASTYCASPDLAEEWNALERVFGLGWAGLIMAKLVGGGLAVAGYAWYLRYRTACYPPSGADFHGFCRFLAYGAPDSGPAMRSRPDAWRRVAMNLGYFWAGMQALVVWVAIDNLLLRYGISASMRRQSETGYHMIQSVVIAAAVLARFYLGNYRRYREMYPATATTATVAPADRQPARVTPS